MLHAVLFGLFRRHQVEVESNDSANPARQLANDVVERPNAIIDNMLNFFPVFATTLASGFIIEMK